MVYDPLLIRKLPIPYTLIYQPKKTNTLLRRAKIFGQAKVKKPLHTRPLFFKNADHHEMYTYTCMLSFDGTCFKNKYVSRISTINFLA